MRSQIGSIIGISMMVTFFGTSIHADPPPQREAPPISKRWLEVIDQGFRKNGLIIDPELSVAIDNEGFGKIFSEPQSERDKAYTDAFLKLRSLASLYLYGTSKGRSAYLELFNPEFLQRFAQRLEFGHPEKRNNLKENTFRPNQLPYLLQYIHHNMTFVLNRWPSFTGTFNAFSSEDDVNFFDSQPGKNGLFKFSNGRANGQTVRTNFSEKLAQMALLTTWLIEGNKELGIPALGVRHPVVVALLTYHMQAMEHDSAHPLQYFFMPVDYLNKLVTTLQPEVLDEKSPDWGMIRPELVKQARTKLDYEMDGAYISGFFRRGNEPQSAEAADFLEDLRSGRPILRGVGRAPWAKNLRSYFRKGGVLEWLQAGTNRRDIVDVIFRGDMIHAERNLWFLNDEKVFPESYIAFMYGQFDPALLVPQLVALNRGEKTELTRRQILQRWEETIGRAKKEGALESMFEEFTYLKAVVGRFEREVAIGRPERRAACKAKLQKK
jgi:hypothetical protein